MFRLSGERHDTVSRKEVVKRRVRQLRFPFSPSSSSHILIISLRWLFISYSILSCFGGRLVVLGVGCWCNSDKQTKNPSEGAPGVHIQFKFRIIDSSSSCRLINKKSQSQIKWENTSWVRPSACITFGYHQFAMNVGGRKNSPIYLFPWLSLYLSFTRPSRLFTSPLLHWG